MRASVVLRPNLAERVRQIQRVSNPSGGIGNRDLRLEVTQLAVVENQAQLALLPSLWAWVGERHEFAGLAYAAKAIMHRELAVQVVALARLGVQAGVQDREGVKTRQCPCEIDSTPGRWHARNS